MLKKTLLITSFLVGAFSVAGFMVATTNHPNGLNFVTLTPKSSPKVAATSNQFNFPKASCGDKPTGANDTWHPVFVDGGDLDTIRHQFCADAISTVRKETKVSTVQLASFTSRKRAAEFAKAVGGDVGQPTYPKFAQNSSTDSNSEVSPVELEVSSVAPSPSLPASDMPAPLVLNAFFWFRDENGLIQWKGQVTNASDNSIQRLAAVVEFYSTDGQFIGSDIAYPEFNPLMPGQSSPFTGLIKNNPQIYKIQIRFKTSDGEISYTEGGSYSQESDIDNSAAANTLTSGGSSYSDRSVYVRSYRRKDGTYVRSHYRSRSRR
jgi:hypothetical protein